MFSSNFYEGITWSRVRTSAVRGGNGGCVHRESRFLVLDRDSWYGFRPGQSSLPSSGVGDLVSDLGRNTDSSMFWSLKLFRRKRWNGVTIFRRMHRKLRQSWINTVVYTLCGREALSWSYRAVASQPEINHTRTTQEIRDHNALRGPAGFLASIGPRLVV